MFNYAYIIKFLFHKGESFSFYSKEFYCFINYYYFIVLFTAAIMTLPIYLFCDQTETLYRPYNSLKYFNKNYLNEKDFPLNFSEYIIEQHKWYPKNYTKLYWLTHQIMFISLN